MFLSQNISKNGGLHMVVCWGPSAAAVQSQQMIRNKRTAILLKQTGELFRQTRRRLLDKSGTYPKETEKEKSKIEGTG